MSWLYVPGMGGSPSDSEMRECQYEPFVTLNGTATQRPFSWHGWKNRDWIRLLCGTISSPSTAQRGVDAWISSLRDSHANRSPLPVNEKALTMTGGSGLPSDGSSVTWDRDTSSWRTSPDLFSTGYLTSSPILPTSGSMRNGVCTPRPTLVPLIDGNASGSWPSPEATAGSRSATVDWNKLDRGFGPSLVDSALLWPTPNTMTGGQSSRSGDRKGELLLGGMARQWPTPRASMNENRTTKNAPSHGNGHGLTLAGEASRHVPTTSTDGNDGSPRADLNPRFVAALMGVPWDWLTPNRECPVCDQ